MLEPASIRRQDADYKARCEKIERELKSHTLPRPPLIVRIPLLGLPDPVVKSKVIGSLAAYEFTLGRNLEWKEMDRLAQYVIADTAGMCWSALTFPAAMALVQTVLTMSRTPRTILAKVPAMAISVPAGLFGAVTVMSQFDRRLENNIRTDPDLRQSWKERAPRLQQLRLNILKEAHEAQHPPPFPVSSSQPSPPDTTASRPDEADDQPSWPQTLQDQDPFGNRPLPPTQDPTWTQDDPLNEVEGAAPAPGTGASSSSWDRLRAQNAATPTTTPQQTWAERRRAALEKTISDQGGDPASSYAGHDEEGARAQTRAQREFDEMLERERRAAEDRGSGGGGRGVSGEKRW